MKFRSRLSFLELETRETPSGVPLLPPVTTSAPAAQTATAGSTTSGSNANGGGQTTSSGSVSPGTGTGTTTTTNTGTTTTTSTTGAYGNNSATGQPLLESSLVNN